MDQQESLAGFGAVLLNQIIIFVWLFVIILAVEKINLKKPLYLYAICICVYIQHKFCVQSFCVAFLLFSEKKERNNEKKSSIWRKLTFCFSTFSFVLKEKLYENTYEDHATQSRKIEYTSLGQSGLFQNKNLWMPLSCKIDEH